MVLVPIARELIRQAVRFGSRYYAAEGKAFSKLYTGFPRSKVIGRGVRHGLVAGGIAGSFINPADDSPGNGIQAPRKPALTASKPYKTRGRQTGRSRSSRRRCYQPNFRSKYTSSSQYR